MMDTFIGRNHMQALERGLWLMDNVVSLQDRLLSVATKAEIIVLGVETDHIHRSSAPSKGVNPLFQEIAVQLPALQQRGVTTVALWGNKEEFQSSQSNRSFDLLIQEAKRLGMSLLPIRPGSISPIDSNLQIFEEISKFAADKILSLQNTTDKTLVLTLPHDAALVELEMGSNKFAPLTYLLQKQGKSAIGYSLFSESVLSSTEEESLQLNYKISPGRWYTLPQMNQDAGSWASKASGIIFQPSFSSDTFPVRVDSDLVTI